MLKNLRCQRNDLHVYCTQLTSHGAEDTASTQFASIVQEHASIVVKADVRAISTADLFLGANNQSLRHCTFFHVARRNGVFDGNDNDVANTGITAAGATQHTNAKSLASTAVISYCKS